MKTFRNGELIDDGGPHPFSYSCFRMRKTPDTGDYDGFDRVWSMTSREEHTDEEIIKMFMEGAEKHITGPHVDEDSGKLDYDEYIITKDILTKEFFTPIGESIEK